MKIFSHREDLEGKILIGGRGRSALRDSHRNARGIHFYRPVDLGQGACPPFLGGCQLVSNSRSVCRHFQIRISFSF